MKRFLFLAWIFFVSFLGCTKSFEETLNDKIIDLETRKNQAITLDEFYEKYTEGKDEYQIKNQKAEWEKSGRWPIIYLNNKIGGIRTNDEVSILGLNDSESRKNKEKFVEIYFFHKYKNNEVPYWIKAYLLKKDAMGLHEGEQFIGYGVISEIINAYMTNTGDSFTIYLYPVQK